MRKLIVSADDFGLSEEVNEAVERAHREGLLSTASLMVAGPAASDAIKRARRLPDLQVGLHCVLVEGDALSPFQDVSHIAEETGEGRAAFHGRQAALGVRYFFHPAARRELRREIRAQFRAFTASGLRLDHANAHKHMHLHPTIGRLMIRIGAEYGLRHIRLPIEPASPIDAVTPHQDGFGAKAMRQWCRVLRWQIRRAGMTTNDWCFGLAWSGAMTPSRVAALMPHLPPGLSEIYFHPATGKNALISSTMPDYLHEAELDALLAPAFRDAVRTNRINLTTWSGHAAIQQAMMRV